MGESERRQKALIEAGLALASELSLPALLQKIVDLACEVAHARYGALGVLAADGHIDGFLTHGITGEQHRRIGRLPQGRGILGVLIHEAQPLRLRRIAEDPRSVGFPANHPPMGSFLGVPVAVRGRVFGNLYLTEKEGGREFTEADEEAAVTLAAQAAVAIENARLHAEVQRLVVIEDRERIAKELHDDIVQSLFAEGMALQAARAVVNDPEAIDARLEVAVDNLDRVIRDLRNYIFALHPGAMADRELERALFDLAESFETGASARIQVDVEPEAASVLAGRASEILQLAREALSNAVQHSGGDQITVGLQLTRDAAVIVVEDNGKGFDLRASSDHGEGLGNLRARAASLEGELLIESVPGRGTRVQIKIPKGVM